MISKHLCQVFVTLKVRAFQCKICCFFRHINLQEISITGADFCRIAAWIIR